MTPDLENAESLTAQGRELYAQGDYTAARPLFEQALAICEAALGPTHPATATSLIAVYKALGGGWEGAAFPRYTQASN